MMEIMVDVCSTMIDGNHDEPYNFHQVLHDIRPVLHMSCTTVCTVVCSMVCSMGHTAE